MLLLAIVLVLVLGIFVIPIIFKDDIRNLISRKLNENLDATVYFDADKFDISLLRNFPNLTVSMGDFGVVGKGDFAGDTLTHVADFRLLLNIKSVLFGDKVEVVGVSLEAPRFLVKVLPDGRANYNIVPETPAEPADTAQSNLAVQINSWEIIDGTVAYRDASLEFDMLIEGLQHQGSGDFAQNVFDMVTKTQVRELTVAYGGVEYLSKHRLQADVTMGIDLGKSEYRFKDNNFLLNDFAFGFDGVMTYPAADLGIDITFSSKENTFRSLLSLLPGIYANSFDKLETSGTLAFEGAVKGIYNEQTMPGFRLGLTVADGRFKYPDLPSEVRDVQAKMEIDAQDGNYDAMRINIPSFQMLMGKNPIKGRLAMQGLGPSDIDADIEAKVDLAEITSIYPLEGLTLKGLYSLVLKAKGRYDETSKAMPNVTASMLLTDGFVQSADYPVPVEQLRFEAKAACPNGNMEAFTMDIVEAALMMGGKPLRATGHVENLDNMAYQFDVDGELDLGIVEKLYPMEGTHLEGHIKAKLSTKGKMSDIEAENYAALPTSGSMVVSDLVYSDVASLPQGLTIKTATISFTPAYMMLSDYVGTAGQSDLAMSGRINDYLGYALQDHPMSGTLDIASKRFNANEWMVDESGEVVEEEGSYGVVPLPANVDFQLRLKAEELLYEKFTLSQVGGEAHLHDGIMEMKNIGFTMLGGSFGMAGLYDPRDLKNPRFNISFGIGNLPLVDAYAQYSSLQAMVPIAKHLDGLMSTSFQISGLLGEDLMPVMSSLNGIGILSLAQAKFTGNSKVLDQLSALTEMPAAKQAELRDFEAEATITDGKLFLQPKPFRFAGFTTELNGHATLDGKLDFRMTLHVPKSRLPKSVIGLAAALSDADTLPLPIRIGGSYATPVVGIDKELMQAAITQRLKAKKGEVTEQVKDAAMAEAEKAKQEAAEKAKQAAAEKLQQAGGQVLGGMLGQGDTTKVKTDSTATNPKAAVEAGKEKLEELKNKWPFKKKKGN
jgi:hypothetical protein